MESRKVSKAVSNDSCEDDIDGLIAAYDGDAKALIAALLEERKMLIHQIELAASAMSVGYGRGWKPKLPIE
ncbi:hypothetical protein BBC0244_018000 [Bartonella apihabitans]|uniref:hypothetical protein n=1 Tax=Bartonella apihabitans TaxID=2750929 RepID=UPI00098EAB79|nr:hypothetical protein [Bartonella apihabitans]AQT45478.1 hypothetical protein BBC0244_018000 [Bartonella apihabitans]